MEPNEVGRWERVATWALFGALAFFHLWGATRNWRSTDLPGNAFRQTQTAITAMFVQREHNFSLAYPTPVLGKPWSVPFEFPLYQWSVAALSDASGLPLVPAGRLVSLLCFYATLPALWLLLGRIGVPRTRRLLVLGVVLSCPLYVFYARAFLIETMALMFSLWFCQGVVAGVAERKWSWIAVANVAGAGAGLVKITTFLVYLVPAGLFAAVWLVRSWRADGGSWGATARRLGWLAAAGAVPLAASLAWLHYADAAKLANPSSRNLVSGAMHSYNFGTWATRVSPEIWAAHGRIIVTNIIGWPGLVLAVGLIAAAGRRWRGWAAGGVALTAAAAGTFPILYAWHEYYWAASAVTAMAGIGLALTAAVGSRRWWWLGWAAALGLYASQIWTYGRQLLPEQRLIAEGGTPLTRALKIVTRPDDVLLIAGEDWGSMTPFYAGRRALMIRRAMDNDIPYLREAFSKLRGERVAALVLRGEMRHRPAFEQIVREYFSFSATPDFESGEVAVYLQPTSRISDLAMLRARRLEGVTVAADATVDPRALTGREVALGELNDEQRAVFAMMAPRPFKYASKFVFARVWEDGRWYFNAHPDVRLWFEVAPGEHTIAMSFKIQDGAYQGLAAEQATDGVEFAIHEFTSEGDYRQIFSRVLQPHARPADRGVQQVEVRTKIARGSWLLIETDPAGSYQRDWALLGPITIK